MANKCGVVDRLSLLPDDILIRILSRLPIRLAIVTGCLSTRWRGLWKNVSSVYVTNHDSQTLSEFCAAFGVIISEIKSPNIYNLTLEFTELVRDSQSCDYSWLREICDRNVRKLKLTWPCCDRFIITLPSFIFQTSSLVSIELDTDFVWQLPNYDPINLPNLRYLSLTFRECEWLEKLIKACPLLEELSLDCNFYNVPTSFSCSSPNVRRLTVQLGFSLDVEIVISAPMLDYLAIYSPMFVTLKFEEEPTGLRELKIVGNGYPGEVSEINGSIYNVRFLTLDVYTLDNISTVFCYATRVSLDMKSSYDIKSVLSLMELCPVLDALSLKCAIVADNDDNEQQSMLQKSDTVSSTLFRGPKKITMETSAFHHCKPQKSFLELIEYLLINGKDLKHFHFVLDDGKHYQMSDAERSRRQRRELNFCKLLYYCPMNVAGCEVEFEGMFLNMSRKAGPKAWSTDGEVIPFDNSPWNGFILEEE